MALWEIDAAYDPAGRPGQATVVPVHPNFTNPPAPSPGAGTGALHPLTILLNAAGALRRGADTMAPPPAPGAPVKIPAPGPEAPQPPAIPWGDVPAPPPGPSADVDRPVVAPPVNSDLFGRILRGVMDANPILDAVPAPVKDRALSIFRLAADRAWRDNSALGAAVSNVESGRGINQAPRTVTYTDHTGRVRTEQAGGDIYGMGYTPEEYAANAAEAERRDIAYRQNAAQKRDQQRALGPLSPAEQATSLISSLFGSLLSPETMIGPGAAAYARAGTAGKAALGAGANAATVGITDPIAQAAAVQRGDRQHYSPAEHALATGGAAALGALIPALGALARRFGALREAPRVDTENRITPLDTENRIEPVTLPSEKVGQPVAPEAKPDLRYTEEGVPIIRITPEKKAEAPAAKPDPTLQKMIDDSLERAGVKPGEKDGRPQTAMPPAARPDAGSPPGRDDVRPPEHAEKLGRESAAPGPLDARAEIGRALIDEATFRSLKTRLESPRDMDEVRALEPIYRALWPDWVNTPKPDPHNDFAFGMWHMVNQKDRFGRVATSDLSKRMREFVNREPATEPAIAEAPRAPEVPTKPVEPAVPARVEAPPEADVPAVVEKPRVDYQTARGSTYTVHEDGTTTRIKAARPEHPGDSGLKPRSEKTIYMTPEDAAKINPQGLSGKTRVVIVEDGTVALSTWNEKSGRWGLVPSGRAKFETTPRSGMAPVELWKGEAGPGKTRMYAATHVGNKIVEPASAPTPARPVDKVDGPRESAGMQATTKEVVPNSRPVFTGNAPDTKSAQVIPGPVRATEQPPDIPDFMRRPMPGKTEPKPEPVEPAPDVKRLRAQIDEGVARRIDDADVRAWAEAKPEDRPALQARIAEKMGVEREKIDQIFAWHNAHTDRVMDSIKGALDSYEATRASIKTAPAPEPPRADHAPPKPAEGAVGKPRFIENAKGEKIEAPRIFWRGENKGDTRRITTGDKAWDSHLFVADNKESASLYGRDLTEYRADPAAKILYQGTKEFRAIAGAWRKNENLLQFSSRAAKAAKDAGYDAVWFKRQGDVGTAIINREKFYPADSAPPKPAQPTDAAPKSTDAPEAPKPTHPGEYADGIKELNASFGLTPAMAKAAGPEMIGAVVGGMYDHWETYGRFGLTTRGALAGALAVAALRHRLPFLSKPIVGKSSLAKDALKTTGDAYAKLATKGPAWLNMHPTMGVERDLWDKLLKVKVETRNFQDDALKIAKYIRENTTSDERILISDWIERRDLSAHGINSWQQASTRVQGMADALTQHVDGLGRALEQVGMLDPAARAALQGEYLHRYYLPKLAADDGFKQKAARMKASASYALRRGESVEGADAGAFKVGDTAVQWTHAKNGAVEYHPAGHNPGADWFSSKQWKVEAIDGKKMDLHRDYTPQERERMGEIRDANFRFAMGSMEASRDLALGKMFQDLAANPRWSSVTDPGGWKKVPTDAVGAGSAIKKYGLLAGRWVSPETWAALKIVRKPWSPDELDGMAGVMNGYLKAMGIWKVGKTAYNPATHFNNVMGNVSLAALTGEVGPVHLMKAIGALKRGDPVIEEARRAGLSLNREANLGDTFDGVRVDVGLASGMDPRTGWTKFMDWYTNNMVVRAYQAEDSVFKLGAYMRRRAAGESPEEAVAGAHKVFFDYSDVPLGVHAVRDFYSPFFTYTYKYAQVMLREAAERPHRYLAAFGILSALDMMSYDWMYGDRAKAVSDHERKMAPKWLQGLSGFGAQKAIRLPANKPDEKTGENRGLFLNTRYLIPGGDILDFVANGDFGPSIYPQALGNTILGGNPLINLAMGLATGKDTFFGKPIMPYPDTNLWDFGKRPAGEIAANWGAAIRFMANQALPPTLLAAPDKIGQGLTAEGAIPKGSQAAEFFGWTGTDFAGRQRSLARAVGSVLGVKIEDVAPDEAMKFREAELAKEVRTNLTNARNLHRNQSTTDTRKENAVESFRDRIQRFREETQKMRDLREKAGAR